MPMITDQSPIAFADDLPDEVDVAVIGAGIIGTATAYWLAERGKSVLLCDKGRVAGEQSSRNFGWVRQQGRDAAELPIMMESNRIWRELEDKTGEPDLAFTPCGFVRLIDSQAELDKNETWRELASEHQLDTRMLSKREVADRFGHVGGDWIGGMGTVSDGRAEPFVAVPALARAARALGVRVIEACSVRAVDIEAGQVTGVVTEKGRVRCGRAVLAGGAWSTHFAANAGFDLPQLAVRSTVVRTVPAPESYVQNFATPGLLLRCRADGGYALSSSDLAEHYISPNSFRYFRRYLKLMKLSSKDWRLRLGAPKGYPGAWGVPRRWSADTISPFERMRVLNPNPSPIVIARVKQRLASRFPELKDVAIADSWAGMIDVTPDAVPTLGEDDSLKGLFIATGLSGHGFGIGPAIGRIMADLVSGRDPGHDLTRFRPQRFFDGSEIAPGPY